MAFKQPEPHALPGQVIQADQEISREVKEVVEAEVKGEEVHVNLIQAPVESQCGGDEDGGVAGPEEGFVGPL